MSNHYIDIYLRVKDERAKLKKLSDGIINMVRNYKLQTRELRSQIKTQGELVRALGRVGDMNTWFDEKEKLC